MKKYIIAIAGTVFFIGLIALAANLSSYGSRGYVQFPRPSDGPAFPEYNITGFDLNTWSHQYNAYPNYTWAGYYVYVYNFSGSYLLWRNGFAGRVGVAGRVNFSLIAFGNDTADPCQGWNCSQITVYSNTSMLFNVIKDKWNNIEVWDLRHSVDYNLRVNYTDILNFLRGYFYGVMISNITSYFNITNSTTYIRTIYLPNYYNDNQINIDCSRQPEYCSGAQPESYLVFFGAWGHNLSITVDEEGYGKFSGTLNLPYIANLINFTSTYYGNETMNDIFQGNASINLSGWVGTFDNRYRITLKDHGDTNVTSDRNKFVQNAAFTFYSFSARKYLQEFLNNDSGVEPATIINSSK